MQTYPIVYALMRKRTIEAYLSVLEYIHNNIIPIRGKGFIIDFEKAMRQALRRVAPNIPILGCWFHMCQALRRKLASIKELFELVRSDSECKEHFRRFQCLALLPEKDITPIFIRLSREALTKSTLFGAFVDYFHNEWISRVTPKFFSVFEQDTRTTGSAENFNCKSNKSFRTHGNFYSFCETLQREELATSTELEHDLNTVVRVRQTKYYKERNKLIKEHSAQLKSGEISPYTFLKIMANIKNKVLYSDKSISIEDVEVEYAVNTELEDYNCNFEDDEFLPLCYNEDSENSLVLNTSSGVDIEDITSKSVSC